jgi:formylglycine-generating enzyme required for sulfatase activity/tetratricopeptide (TPR) repeat protein
VRRDQGNPARALADYDQAIALRPDYADAYNNRGSVRSEQGDLAGALADCDQAVALKPDDALVYYNRALVRRKQGDLASALADYDQAIALKPDYVSAYYSRAMVRTDQGDLAGALADYDQVIALKPDDATAYSNRGGVRHEQGDLAGALADYDQAIALRPDFIPYYNRAMVRTDWGDLAGALADYDQVIALKPDYSDAYKNRAIIRREQGDLAGALADYDQVIALKLDYATYNDRSVVRRVQGDLAGALADCDQAITLQPDEAILYYNRGLVRMDQGDLAGALADYVQYLELGGGRRYGNQEEIEYNIRTLQTLRRIVIPEPETVDIEAGAFMMGSPESDNRAYMDERWHKVDIRSGFAMAIYPVTYDEYAIFAQTEGRGMPDDGGWGGGKRPVTNVSYEDATEFARWLTRLTGHRYRLPTEAEWEFAARAGTTTRYAEGDELDATRWRFGLDEHAGPIEVDQTPSNAWGIRGCHGNVWELTGSKYDADYDGSERHTTYGRVDTRVVARGGAWDSNNRSVRSAARLRVRQNDTQANMGFRLVRERK